MKVARVKCYHGDAYDRLGRYGIWRAKKSAETVEAEIIRLTYIYGAEPLRVWQTRRGAVVTFRYMKAYIVAVQ